MSVRAFCDQPVQPSDVVVLDAQESHYVVRVRRLRIGQPLELLAPTGGGWRATLIDANAKRAQLQVHDALPPRPPRPFDLGVGLIETRAAYEAIARACEAGARSLTWLHTARSLNSTLKRPRIDRVVASACRQCGRLDPLPVHGPISLETWTRARSPGLVSLIDPRENDAAPRPDASVDAILIGPEGGWTDEETTELLDARWISLGLGPFVLRTEVAVVAALASVDR